MWKESSEDNKPLRTGLTTGTCAAACAVAAAEYLLANHALATVSVTLSKGKTVELTVSIDRKDPTIVVSTIKDAGDDPDVTHGARIYVELQLIEKNAVEFNALQGVGTITREGLRLPVGEPAINPVPRKMISENLYACAKKYGYRQGFTVAIGIENGESIAKKTMNTRLGIVGGLSILGTTGIVRPFSCAAWIASIHQGIDVANTNHIEHIAASTGNSSEHCVKEKYPLHDMALIEMGDFAGAVLKHLKKKYTKGSAIKKLSVCGGFGKMTKLANGHMDLNIRVSSIDFAQLASLAKQLGASDCLQHKILNANTSIEAYMLCKDENIHLAPLVCEQALRVVRNIIPSHIGAEVLAINRQGELIATASEFGEAHQQ